MNSESDILSLLAEGLEAASLNQANLELRDRGAYLGLSDLSKALACERAVILDKLDTVKKPRSLQTLLRLSRRHWLEQGIETALENLGVSFIRQMKYPSDQTTFLSKPIWI